MGSVRLPEHGTRSWMPAYAISALHGAPVSMACTPTARGGHTRPDISFAVGFVSRFMEKPRQEHMAAVKHLLRYIVGTIEYGIIYPKLSGGDNSLIGYSESDLGGDTDDRKSTTGIIFFLGQKAVAW